MFYVIFGIYGKTGYQPSYFVFSWLPPRDSNPDMLIQSQLSYH